MNIEQIKIAFDKGKELTNEELTALVYHQADVMYEDSIKITHLYEVISELKFPDVEWIDG